MLDFRRPKEPKGSADPGTFDFLGFTHYWTMVQKIWRKWLARRYQRARGMHWERFQRLLKDYPLPPARAIHSIYLNAANP